MPATESDQANKTADILRFRAGAPCQIQIMMDADRAGFVSLINQAVLDIRAEYYVYVAQDAFPGRNWLAIALDSMRSTGAGLLGFNDGKWQGAIASFGLVHRSFLLYDGRLFYPRYKQHFADYELTLIAKQRDRYIYDPNAVLIEVDYLKDSKTPNVIDKRLFLERQYDNFPIAL